MKRKPRKPRTISQWLSRGIYADIARNRSVDIAVQSAVAKDCRKLAASGLSALLIGWNRKRGGDG